MFNSGWQEVLLHKVCGEMSTSAWQIIKDKSERCWEIACILIYLSHHLYRYIFYANMSNQGVKPVTAGFSRATVLNQGCLCTLLTGDDQTAGHGYVAEAAWTLIGKLCRVMFCFKFTYSRILDSCKVLMYCMSLRLHRSLTNTSQFRRCQVFVLSWTFTFNLQKKWHSNI